MFGHCPENIAHIQILLGGEVSYLTKRGRACFGTGYFCRSSIEREISLTQSRTSSTLLFYARSKFTGDWYQQQPHPPDAGACLRKLERRNPQSVERSVRRFFPDGTNPDILNRYMEELRRIVELTESNGSRLVLILPPTLLGELPGTKEFHAALNELLEPHSIPYHDFSNAVENVGFFHDHDHLNDDGAHYFFDTYLAPALLESDRDSDAFEET